jgi:hypothetical protein
VKSCYRKSKWKNNQEMIEVQQLNEKKVNSKIKEVNNKK